MIEADYNKVLEDLLKEREAAYIRKYCPVFEPEAAHYTIKTTAPYFTTTWKLNFLRLQAINKAWKGGNSPGGTAANLMIQSSSRSYL